MVLTFDIVIYTYHPWWISIMNPITWANSWRIMCPNTENNIEGSVKLCCGFRGTILGYASFLATEKRKTFNIYHAPWNVHHNIWMCSFNVGWHVTFKCVFVILLHFLCSHLIIVSQIKSSQMFFEHSSTVADARRCWTWPPMTAQQTF